MVVATRRHGRAALVWVGLLALGASRSVAAQTAPGETTRPSITVTGESSITAVADQARVELGVVSQGANAREAAERNAQRLERVLAELRRALRRGSTIETVGYTLNPDYQYPRDGGQPTITGYTATNVVRVTTDDLTQVGPIVDTAIRAGANNVQSLQFTLKDEQEIRVRALRQAATRARAKGEALATALGVRILRVYQVREEPSAVVRPFVSSMAMEKAAPSTPIEPGRIEVEARVTLVLEISR